jgi:Tol biopolymer transport system component
MRTKTWIVLVMSAALALTTGAKLKDTQQDLRPEAQLQAAINKETVEGDLRGAIELYKKITALPDAGRATVATALLRMGLCHEKLGSVEATKAYERLVREFADQKETVAAAQARLAALGQGPASAEGVTIRQVLADAPLYGAQGEPSRDGSYLTFRTAEGDLAIRDLATGQVRQLTNYKSDRGSAWNSVPSPDGKQIAYLWREPGAWEMRVVGLDGAEPRVLCSKADADVARPSDAVRPFPADWSPDGTSILIVLWHFMDPGSEIALVSARDGSVRILKDFDKRLTERPRFSPDGRFIVFDRQQRPGEKSDIFVLALDGGLEIPLIEHPANDMSPDWTPDGKGILFFSDRTGTMGAWWIPVADGSPQGTPELLKRNVQGGMGFTRNGSYYYSIRTEMMDVYIAELDLTTGKLISAPRAATQRFVGSNGGPDWSPDGRQLLFSSKLGPGAPEDRWGPCVLSSESGEVRELASKFDRIRHVRWAPDGRSVLASVDSGHVRIDVQTGDAVRIPPLLADVVWLPAMSHDCKSVFYQTVFHDTKRFCVMERDIETGEDRELYSTATRFAFASRLSLSPDGRQLAFVFNEDDGNSSKTLKVLPAAGGETRDVMRGLQIPYLEAPIAWTPDGASLLFLRQPQDRNSKTELWAVSVQGGEPRKLGLSVEGMIDISVNPDGRRIAFTQVRSCDEVWVMENFLPASQSPRK